MRRAIRWRWKLCQLTHSILTEADHRYFLGWTPDRCREGPAGGQQLRNSLRCSIEIGHEYQAPSAERGVEVSLLDCQGFCIGFNESEVAKSKRARAFTRQFEHGSRLIGCDNKATRPDLACRCDGFFTRTGFNIEHPIRFLDSRKFNQPVGYMLRGAIQPDKEILPARSRAIPEFALFSPHAQAFTATRGCRATAVRISRCMSHGSSRNIPRANDTGWAVPRGSLRYFPAGPLSEAPGD
jgi:hypothetical protein